jgi:hypothetical protein
MISRISIFINGNCTHLDRLKWIFVADLRNRHSKGKFNSNGKEHRAESHQRTQKDSNVSMKKNSAHKT